DDLAVLDGGRRLHDFDRADVADGSGGGRDGLTRGVAPGARAGADHLADDDYAHRGSLQSGRGRPILRLDVAVSVIFGTLGRLWAPAARRDGGGRVGRARTGRQRRGLGPNR